MCNSVSDTQNVTTDQSKSSVSVRRVVKLGFGFCITFRVLCLLFCSLVTVISPVSCHVLPCLCVMFLLVVRVLCPVLSLVHCFIVHRPVLLSKNTKSNENLIKITTEIRYKK